MPKQDISIPVGQYIARRNTTTGFNTFSVGDSIIVKDSASNDGIYTINSIATDGSHSYAGVTGPPLTTENEAGTDTSINISGVGTTGDKLIALGNEDSGVVSIWSYNASTDDDAPGASSGTMYESNSNGLQIGTSGWSSNAIAPVLDGGTSQFVFTAGQSALRVCDSNDANTSLVKHFKFYDTTQFRSAGNSSTIYGSGSFLGWEEHSNFLAKPSSGWFLGGGGQTGAENSDRLDTHDTRFYGFSPGVSDFITGTSIASVDYMLARPLNALSSTEAGGGYSTASIDTCQLKSAEVKDPPATQTFLKLTSESISKLPIGSVIGLTSVNGSTGYDQTYISERMLVRKIDIQNNKAFVYRGYGTTTPATIDISAYPYIVQYGCGWNFTCQWGSANSGFYMPGEYEFATSFIYDGDQESLLRTNNDLRADGTYRTFEISEAREFCDLAILVGAHGPYPARVTGGRIYIREKDADDDWHLLVDIDLEKGLRSTLTSDYTGWTAENIGVDQESGATIERWLQHANPQGVFCSREAIRSKRPSMETYQSINNFYPDIRRNSIGYLGENYKCSTVGGERAWYGNLKLREGNGLLNRYGDRVMYSEYRKYDTIPGFNYINAAEGDSDDIVELKYFADKLFIFKSSSLHIWNVKHNEPSQWYPEQTIRKTGGIAHPCSAVSTTYGIVWANLHGCYYHDGQKVQNLINEKIRATETAYHNVAPSWATFVLANDNQVNPMVIFSAKEKQLYVMKDPTESGGSTENQCYIYNFISKSWVYNDSIFTHSRAYTNPILDWNDNIVVAHEEVLDTGLDLDSAFAAGDNLTDIISEVKNRDFSASSGWTHVTASGSFTNSAPAAYLISSHPANTTDEGFKLLSAKMGTRILNSVYRCTFELYHTGSVGAMDDVEIHVDFCGNDVVLGIINSAKTKYTIDIECGDATGNVRIFHSTTNATAWRMSSASIKEITLDTNAAAYTKVNYGDVLKVDSEDFLVIGTNSDANTDKIMVKPGHNGTTKAAHSSGVQVNAYKAVFEQLSSTSVSTGKPAFITKDFDFDDPSRVKKIYKIYITYMNSAGSQLDNLIKVAADGNTTWEQGSIATPHSRSTYALTGSFLASQSKWNVAVFEFDSPFPCQSIALYFNPDAVVNGLSINDISFEYRTIHKRVS